MILIPEQTNPPLRLLMQVPNLLERHQPDFVVQAPGRDVWVAAVVQQQAEYTVYSLDDEADTTFSHRSAKSLKTVLKRPLPVWARYPAGVVAMLGDAGMDLPGFEAVIVSEEPSGPGCAFAVGLAFTALCHVITVQDVSEAEMRVFVDRVRRQFVDR